MKQIGIQDIARLASVSIGTVDRALHGRKDISESTRKRVLGIASELGYKPNLAARALSVGRRGIRIGLCIPREIRFFYDQLREGVVSEARRFENQGVEVVYRPVERLGVGEADRVRELLESRVQALALSPGDHKSLTPLIDEAEEKRNIRVVCVSSDAPFSRRSSVVCVDPEVNGHLAAELLGKFLPPASEVAVITGMSWTEDHRKKVEGFSAFFPRFCPRGKVVEVVEGHDDEDETFQKVFALLERRTTLRGLYVSTAACVPVCHAVGAKGLYGKVKLIATDLGREMVPYFEKGAISASIHQRAYVQGQAAIRLLVDYFVNGHDIPSTYYLIPQIVMGANLHLFREIRQHGLADTHP